MGPPTSLAPFTRFPSILVRGQSTAIRILPPCVPHPPQAMDSFRPPAQFLGCSYLYLSDFHLVPRVPSSILMPPSCSWLDQSDSRQRLGKGFRPVPGKT